MSPGSDTDEVGEVQPIGTDPWRRLVGAAAVFAVPGRLEPWQAENLSLLCEALYRAAGDRRTHSEIWRLLRTLRRHGAIVRGWRVLLLLHAARRPMRGFPLLAALDEVLGAALARAGIVLRTEAARELFRLTSDAASSWRRLAAEPLPRPELQEAAVDAATLRLRLAAAAGQWQEHGRLAAAIDEAWLRTAGVSAGHVAVAIAEGDVTQGRYAAAIERLRAWREADDTAIRLASLEISLRALVVVLNGAASERVAQDARQVAGLLCALLTAPPPDRAGAARDWHERSERARYLLSGCEGQPANMDRASPLVRALALADERPWEALAVAESTLRDPPCGQTPEELLRLRLLWTRLSLNLRGLKVGEAAEEITSGAIEAARRCGLPLLEMDAWDLRAILRARCFSDRWPEAMADAGHAANLAVELLSRNEESDVERPLRAQLLPILDRAVDLLAEGADRVRGNPAASAETWERFGRAALDYVEQSMELGLSEARRLRAGSIGPREKSLPVGRSVDLQAECGPREAVLQYFLITNYLLVFTYGADFFTWHLEKIEPSEGLPGSTRETTLSRQLVEPLLPLAGLLRGADPPAARDATARPRSDSGRPRDLNSPRPAEIYPAARAAELGRHLLPPPIEGALERLRSRRLAIVPHDILYRAPFGQLPWQRSTLGSRFELSVHPTGKLAVQHAATSGLRRRRPRIGFFQGPGLEAAPREFAALATAWGGGDNVTMRDTTARDVTFALEAGGFDALYLACHGSLPSTEPADDYLALGPAGQVVHLSEVAALDLGRCRLAVVQACWTGWLNHRRELPVQGFPQALRDAGVAAVVAPMFPVIDALCPVFTAVYARALRFLSANRALGYTLDILRRHGQSLCAAVWQEAWDPSLWCGPNTFDAYEYRFTGAAGVSLGGSWISRCFRRLHFYAWLLAARRRGHLAR